MKDNKDCVPRLCRGIVVGVVHGHVPVDEEALPKANDLDTDVERDGHKRVEDDDVREELERSNGVRVVRIAALKVDGESLR